MNHSVSIIIPVFNGANHIRKSVKTALAQDYTNFDVIVVNDGSSDNTLKILSEINSPLLKVIHLDTNQGRSIARNEGVKRSSSEFVSFLDADDEIVPNKLTLQMEYIYKNNLDLCGTWGFAVADDFKVLYKQPIDDKTIKSRIIKSHTFIHSTVICRRIDFLNHGGYDKNLSFSEDYDLFLRMVPNVTTGNLPIPTVNYLLPSGMKYALKEQLAIALIRLKAILRYGYNRKNILFVVTPVVSIFVPRKLKLLLKRLLIRS